MQITKHTNYALRMLMYCAAHEGAVRLVDVVSFYGLSHSFMQKVLQATTKAGFLTTTRGRTGGLQLSRPATEITVGEVVRAMEDRFEMAECFRDDVSCPLEKSCGLNTAFHEALAAFLSALDGYTIADITDERANIKVLTMLEAMTRMPLNEGEVAKID